MKNVLIVEDDTSMAEILVEEVEKRGMKPWRFSAVGAAKDVLQDEDFALLILDWDLGLGGNGMQVAQGYKGGGLVVLFSGLNRDRELDGWERKPDRTLLKGDFGPVFDVLDEVAASE